MVVIAPGCMAKRRKFSFLNLCAREPHFIGFYWLLLCIHTRKRPIYLTKCASLTKIHFVLTLNASDVFSEDVCLTLTHLFSLHWRKIGFIVHLTAMQIFKSTGMFQSRWTHRPSPCFAFKNRWHHPIWLQWLICRQRVITGWVEQAGEGGNCCNVLLTQPRESVNNQTLL